MRYLLVTHIPFARQGSAAVLDKLWAEDLKGTAGSMGPITVAAPELARGGHPGMGFCDRHAVEGRWG